MQSLLQIHYFQLTGLAYKPFCKYTKRNFEFNNYISISIAKDPYSNYKALCAIQPENLDLNGIIPWYIEWNNSINILLTSTPLRRVRTEENIAAVSASVNDDH